MGSGSVFLSLSDCADFSSDFFSAGSAFLSADLSAPGGGTASFSFDSSTGGIIFRSYGAASPPRKSRRKSWVCASRLARKKMAEPSGAHAPLCSPRLSVGGEKVSWRALSVPAGTATIQRWDLAPSAVESVTVKSACLPSGDSWGAEMALRWRRSSLVG